MNGDAPLSTASLWRDLLQEVERLSANRPRGVNYSEDFAVDRACAALAKLERNYASAGDASPDRSEPTGDTQRSAAQQAKLDAAREQVAKARATRDQLAKQLEEEERGRRASSESQVSQWRDATLKTHACSASLRAKELERSQLEQALSSPSMNLSEVWEGVMQKLQAELETARNEAAEARRELQRLVDETSRVEAAAAGHGIGAQSSQPAPGGPQRASLGALSSSVRSVGAEAATTPRPSETLGGLLRPTTTEGRRSFSRDELLRIASRATDAARSLQAAAANAGMANACTRQNGSLTVTNHASPDQQATSAWRAAARETRPMGFTSAASNANILEEAQRIVATIEPLRMRRSMLPG